MMLSYANMKSTHKYFPIKDAQRTWGLYATCAGHSQTEPGDEFPSAAHPDEYFFTWGKGRILHEWQFSLIEQGRGTVEFRNRRYAVRKGSLMVLPPECWHRYRPNKKTGWTTLWFGISGDLASRLIGGIGFRPEGEVRSLSHFPKSLRLFESTIRDILGRDSDHPYSTVTHILSLVTTIIDESSHADDGALNADLINRAQSHILEHVTEAVDFEALAESLGLPYRTLRYMFKKETGASLLQYQLDIRLARAKNLLRSTDMQIAEIARTLGFNSTWYFAHFFQQRIHMSAAAYRKKHKATP